MQIRRFAVLFALLVAAVPAQQASLRVPELRVLELHGTPYERGFQHGEALREEIAGMLEHWAGDVRAVTGLESDAFVERFLAASGFEEAARRHTPELLDEVRGIAAGAGQPYDTMFAYQLIDELWAQAGLVQRDKCSTIGVDRDVAAPGLVAQNLDIPPWMHAHPTVLRIRHPDRDLESLVLTIPGVVGANGLNSRRVAVGVNTILQLRPSPDGLPVAFVVRGLLAQDSHAAALAFLRRVPHASGQAYTVGGPDASPCFECSAGGVARWQPADRAGWTWHTNHPLASRDWSDRYLAAAAQRGFEPADHPRCPRFDALDAALPAGARPTLDQVVGALQIASPASPVCNPHTYCCTVMVLGPEPELRIAVGRPDRAPFQVLRFEARSGAPVTDR